jgi:uncharacterized protein GlcG (DUF336 family)
MGSAHVPASPEKAYSSLVFRIYTHKILNNYREKKKGVFSWSSENGRRRRGRDRARFG